MTADDRISRGARLWLQPAGQKVAHTYAEIQDVVLGVDGRPACLVTTMTDADGEPETVIVTLERGRNG